MFQLYFTTINALLPRHILISYLIPNHCKTYIIDKIIVFYLWYQEPSKPSVLISGVLNALSSQPYLISSLRPSHPGIIDNIIVSHLWYYKPSMSPILSHKLVIGIYHPTSQVKLFRENKELDLSLIHQLIRAYVSSECRYIQNKHHRSSSYIIR